MIKFRLDILFQLINICVIILSVYLNGYVRESSDRRFQGGNIYNNSASSFIWVENKVSLASNETVMGKSRFDQCLYALDAAKFSHYHEDNIIFTAAEYLHDCKQKGQTQSFSGVGPSTITRDLNVPFKMLCIWLVFSLCMLHCIGMIKVLKIYLCGLLMLSIQFGFITNFPENNQASLL